MVLYSKWMSFTRRRTHSISPQAAAVEQLGHHAVGVGHLGDDPAHLLPGQDGGQAFGFLGAQGINGAVQFFVKDIAVKE